LGALYTLCLPSHPATAAPMALVASASTWHRHLSHPSVDILSKLSNNSSVHCSRRTHDIYHACQLSRHSHMPFVSSTSHAENNFDLIHCDLWTSAIGSVSGYKYYMAILDDCSHFVWTFPLQLQSDTFTILSLFSLMSPHSLAAPSKLSSATMVVSSTMPPPGHSLPTMVWLCGCHSHRLLNRMVKSSTLSVPLTI
jgi:hypothetical protein